MQYSTDIDEFAWDYYPDLAYLKNIQNHKMIPAGLKVAEMDILVKFCIYILAMDSPMYEIKNLSERVKRGKAKFGITKIPMVNDMIDNDNDAYHWTIKNVFALINNDLYELWFSRKTALRRLNSMLRSPSTEPSIILRISKDIQTLAVEVSKLESTIFGSKSITDTVNKVNIREQYPEMYALDFDHIKNQ